MRKADGTWKGSYKHFHTAAVQGPIGGQTPGNHSRPTEEEWLVVGPGIMHLKKPPTPLTRLPMHPKV